MTITKLHLIISNADLLQSIKSALSEQFTIMSSNNVAEYLATTELDDVNLVVCEKSILDDDKTALASIKSVNSDLRVLVLGSACTSSEQVSFLKRGARGYFDNSLSFAKLSEAVQCVLHGEVWIERHVISGLIDELTHEPEISDEQRQTVATLSPKELEVAKLVSHGATNKMIAKNMSITERTVKAHLTAIFQKMNLTDRLSLAIFFRDLRE